MQEGFSCQGETFFVSNEVFIKAITSGFAESGQ